MESKIMKHIDSRLLKEINMMINAPDVITDNNFKADVVSKYMRQEGFTEIGCGTNRIVFRRGKYVYKIALDSQGVADNESEYELSGQMQPYVTECYENNGLVSVQELVLVMDSNQFQSVWRDISSILKRLSKSYVLDDVGPKSFMNWGFRENGDIVILDYAYLVSNKGMDFKCMVPECDGDLDYNSTFTKLVCVKCNAKFNISEVKGRTEDAIENVDFNTTGLDCTSESSVYSEEGFNTCGLEVNRN